MADERIDTDIDLSGDTVRTNTTRDTTRVADDGSTTVDLVERKQPVKNAADELDVEIVDDTPEQDRNRARRAPGTEPNLPSDEELRGYTKNVQDRFKQMRWEYHEERRGKETALRENQAAIDYANRVLSENKNLRKLLEDGHKTMLSANKSATESELGALRQNLKSALESGNSELAADLQEKLSRAAARAVQIEQTQPLKFEEAPAQQQQPQPQQRVTITNSMQDWMDRNRWFNQDRRMTSYAFGVHDELVAQGVPPESPAYYRSIDEEMRKTFPDKFKNGRDDDSGRASGRSIVARVDRSGDTGGGPNTQQSRSKVQLTASEVAIAKRMGVPLQEYAKQKLILSTQDRN